MAEDAVPQYKEEKRTVSDPPGRRFRETEIANLRRARYASYRRAPGPLDYRTFKATFASAVEEIKLEVREQHQQTRAEIQSVRTDVVAAVKSSPAQYVKLACQFGILFLVFSLAVRFVFKIELVNTAFALFMLPSLAVYWAMAHLKERSSQQVQDDRQ